MASKTTSASATATSAADAGKSVEAAVHNIRELTDRLVESAKSAGQASLDAYQSALESLLEFEEKAAGASQLDWISNITAAHAKFMQDVSAAYVSAARKTLE